MNWNNFTIGFWSTFGPHGRETPDEILDRKTREIDQTGWTLWSFQYRTPATIQNWIKQIEAAKPGPIYAMCSDSPAAKEQTSPVGNCTKYQLLHNSTWQDIPPTIKVPHPFSSINSATAFVVKSIIHLKPIHVPPFKAERFSVDTWKNNALPGQGSPYLIKRGGHISLRHVRALLELQPPYVVQVKP